MVELPEGYAPHTLESEARALWQSRRFPAADGTIGTSPGPMVRQFEGSFAPGDNDELTILRAVAADADARYLCLAGRRASGTLRAEGWRGFTLVDRTGPLLQSLGVWTGGRDGRPWEMGDRHERVQRLVDRLARSGIFVVHDAPLRLCPVCAAPRSPDQIVYRSEDGPTYLVRFPVQFRNQDVHVLVWVDAPWRLLGTSALLVHPELPYVIARYRRRDAEELVLTSRSSLERLSGWIAGSSFEVLEEFPGRELTGAPYVYPLRHEFPLGGTLTPPAGTVQATREVGNSGTGIVPLVPGHGGTDAQIAERLGVPGWPLVTLRGQFDLTLMHKYSGLDLRSGSEFVVRDLQEGTAVFAELKVRRGVPHCGVCGTPLLWTPGRAWRLELGKLPKAQIETFARLLPRESPLGPGESATWPISDTATSEDPTAPVLLECARCDRLEPIGAPGACPCGGRRRAVRRPLLPSIAGALAAWTREDPLPSGDAVRLYLSERRGAPVLVHHLVAISALDGRLGEINLTLLPTVLSGDLPSLVERHGADAVRVALVSLESSGAATASLPQRCAQEHERLRRLWATARGVLALCDPALTASFARSITSGLDELEPEDRAILARWERVRVHALADYDRWNAASALRRVFRFLETDFLEYRDLVSPRFELAGMPALKRSALRTTVHLLRGASVLLGPVAPHTAEGIHRAIVPERPSVFDEPPLEVERALLDDDRARSWARWLSVLRAVDRVRSEHHVPRSTRLPAGALVLDNEQEADRYRSDRPVLERLAHVARLAIGSPREPWTGRQRELRPVESEIQRVYPREASQIIHVLRRMPAKSGSEPAPRSEMSIIIAGTPRRILASMVEYVDVLPERVVPAPWPAGELYLELPANTALPPHPLPPLSADAHWLVARLERRLDAAGEPAETRSERIALVAVADPLAAEISTAADLLADYLGIREVRVATDVAEPPPGGRIYGRTRTGASWWVHVPGLPPRPYRVKPRSARPRAPRVVTEVPAQLVAAPEVNYADDAVTLKAQSVRVLGEELDTLLGAPLLGPAKVARAWDAGLQSVEDFGHASYDTLVALPGFGRPIAVALIEKFGGKAPPPPPRAPRIDVVELPPGPLAPPVAGPATPPGAVGSASTPVVVAPQVPAPPPPSQWIARRSPTAAATVPAPPVPPAAPQPPPETALPPETPPSPSPPERWVTTAETDLEETVEAGEAPASLPPETALPAGTPAPGAEPSPAPPPSAPPSPPPVTATAGEPAPEIGPVAEPETEAAPEALPPEAETTPEGPAAVPTLPVEPTPPTEPLPTPEVSSAPEAPPPEPTPIPESPASGPETPVELATGTEPAAPLETTAAAEQPPSAPEPVAEAPTPGPAVPSELAPETEPVPEAEVIPPPAALPAGSGPAVELTAPIPPEEEAGEVEAPATPVEEGRAPREEAVPAASLEAPLPDEPPLSPAPEPASGIETQPSPALTPIPVPEPGVPPVTVPEPPPPPQAEVEVPVPSEPPIVPERLPEVPPAELPPEAEPAPPPPPVEPPATPAPAPVPPPSGGIEIEVGLSFLPSLQRFLDASAAGHQGICVVRESPERVRAYVGSRPVEIYWLTNLGHGSTLKPGDLAGLETFLEKSLVDRHVSVFFLEGVEYLVRIHGLERVMTRLVAFDHVLREHEGRAWLHVNPKLLTEAELEQLTAPFGAAGGSSPAAP